MTDKGKRSILQRWAGRVRKETYAVYLAARDERTPWYAKAIAIVVVGYALSPIDLVPDFIPVLGYLDDLVIVPAGLAIAVRLIPSQVMEECRARASQKMDARANWKAAAVVVVIWLALAALAVFLLVRALR
jgi:uncharacterized membrane protein YkvA (DUF1232 family)